MHHPPDWLVDGEQLETFLQTRPHIIFCGHIHKAGGLIGSPLHGHGLVRVVAGAGHLEHGVHPEHSYSGRISNQGLEYFPRVWAPAQGRFRADRNRYETVEAKGAVLVKRDRLPNAFARWLPRPMPIILRGKVEWLNDPKGQWLLRLEGSLDDLSDDRIDRILSAVRDLSGDVNVTLVAMAGGSVNMMLTGSEKGYNTFYRKYKDEPEAISAALE